MAVTCRDCAIPYEVWPEAGCPNCGSAEPAGDAVTGDGSGAPLPEFDGTTVREFEGTGVPMKPVPAKPTRTRAGRRGGQATPQAGDSG